MNARSIATIAFLHLRLRIHANRTELKALQTFHPATSVPHQLGTARKVASLFYMNIQFGMCSNSSVGAKNEDCRLRHFGSATVIGFDYVETVGTTVLRVESVTYIIF